MTLVAAPSAGQTGEVSGFTMDNAPGHVPMIFINNTRFDQNLLDYLEETGVDVSDPNIRPRVRVLVEITYANGNTNEVEFVDGSSVIEGLSDGTSYATPPALTEFTLTNTVLVCDVARIEPTRIEVFVPTTMTTIGFEEVNDQVIRTAVAYLPPQFVTLLPDMLDSDNNVSVIRNFDVRNAPVEVDRVQCGSVIGFTISGTLSISYASIGGSFIPGYLEDDTVRQSANPGRFKFTTNIR